MKTSMPRSLLLVISAPFFFGTPVFAEETDTNWFWPLTGEYVAEGTYVGEGDVERNSRKRVEDFDEIDSNLRLVLTPRTNFGVLRLGAEWERLSFGLPDGAQLPNTLQSFSKITGPGYAVFRFDHRRVKVSLAL
jgi:hypothetical protein